MDPHHQQTLLNEVLYLHSLYHHGPPPSTSSPPSSQQWPAKLSGWPEEQTPFEKTLHLTNHTHFKKPISKKPKKTQRHHFSGKEWPVKPPVDQSPATLSGWPELKLKPNLKKPTKQELELCNWNQTQAKAVEKVKDFYKLNKNDTDDDDVSNDSMEDDDDVSSEDECGEDDKEDGFYWELFNGDEDLKEKYVKGCLGGVCEFTCLVCGGVSEKYGKRFKDCVGLVQHAVTVKKTKRRRGHRVFGKVVCRVLGWDIDKLPSSSVAECKNSELQGTDVNADKDVNIASSNSGLDKTMDSGNSNGEAVVASEVVDGESMVCEDVAVITNVEEENKTEQVLNEAVGNCQQSLQELVINNGAGSSISKKVDDME